MRIKLVLPFLCALALSFGACSSPRQFAPVHAPSTVGVQESATRIDQRVTSAQSHAVKAKTAVQDAQKAAPKDAPATLTLALGTADSEIDALSSDLLSAKTETAVLQGKVQQLDTQIKDVTKTANDSIAANQNLQRENANLHDSVSRWRKISLFAIGAVLLCGVWIFRKPLALLVGL